MSPNGPGFSCAAHWSRKDNAPSPRPRRALQPLVRLPLRNGRRGQWHRGPHALRGWTPGRSAAAAGLRPAT